MIPLRSLQSKGEASAQPPTRSTLEPVAVLVFVLVALALISGFGAAAGWSAMDARSGQRFEVQNLISRPVLAKLLAQAPTLAMSFPPLGIILIMSLGVGVAETSGLLNALVRTSLLRAPDRLMTPTLVVTGFIAHQVSDVLFFVYVPMAGAAFAARGRDPLLGIATAFAAFSGGFAANLVPGQQDLVLLAITHKAVVAVTGDGTFNPLGNWYFTAAVALIYAGATWWLVDGVLEPKTRSSRPARADIAPQLKATSPRAALGLAATGVVLVAAVGLVLLWPDPPKAGVDGLARFSGLFMGLPALLSLSMVAGGAVYGRQTGSLPSTNAIIAAMGESLARLAPYILVLIAVSIIAAVLEWSNLGPIVIVSGISAMAEMSLPPVALLLVLIVITALVDLVIGSATAKWAIMAPLLVPVLMASGISPELTTAAYRIGDSATNIVSPMAPWVTMALIFGRVWAPNISLIGLIRIMWPFAVTYMVLGVMVVGGWVLLGLPPGPGAEAGYGDRTERSLTQR